MVECLRHCEVLSCQEAKHPSSTGHHERCGMPASNQTVEELVHTHTHTVYLCTEQDTRAMDLTEVAQGNHRVHNAPLILSVQG